MKTPWGESLDQDHILQEYPRPQLRRDSYLNLNGCWEYAITSGDAQPETFDGTILVPFSPESELSGVNRTLHAQETLWYRRALSLPEGFAPDGFRVLLHFGAVDQEATVYLNGKQVAYHMGGFTAFTADITAALERSNILTVRVKDDTDGSWHSRGKQKGKRGGIWYTPQSGIWQTVWLEAVPEKHIAGLWMAPSFLQGTLTLTVRSAANHETATVTIGDVTYSLPTNTPTALPIPNPHPWTPEDPFLYDFTVTLGKDRAISYFGLRDTCVQKDIGGIKRLFLNGKPYFHNGLLDQGYWPDGLLTPPSEEAMVFDIQTAKDMGFNLLRKHIKVEPLRWYYHCDRLGMLVWQDMVNGGGRYHFPTVSFPLITGIHLRDHHYRAFARQAKEGREEFLREMEETVLQVGNSPSLVLWVPFNEGWGQFDAAAVCERLHALDPSRPMDPASGWHDQKTGDLRSFHVYFMPYRFRPDKLGRAVALSEFGGYNLRLEGHTHSDIDYGYKRLKDTAALQAAYEKLYETEILPATQRGLCAAVYTQLTDVEDELNGLITYDRRVVKLPFPALQALNARLMAASDTDSENTIS